MPVRKRVRVDSLDVHSCYSRGSTKKKLSGELRGYFWMKSCTGAVILIGSLYLESGEL
ncbi:hypothetical protein Golax_022630 [Gossypium laxum]|uniref:Uncharacterized protein n=1 Tax=Gossypium laxum TaxID=34288 RepID=A0A7J9AYY1_9ROSI|nr:hypothetical protein [Gossypium laxum]